MDWKFADCLAGGNIGQSRTKNTKNSRFISGRRCGRGVHGNRIVNRPYIADPVMLQKN